MNSSSPAAKEIPPVSVKALLAAQNHASLWKCGLVLLFGFCIEFNPLVGVGGEVAAAGGLYGFRLIDVVSFGAVGLLALYSLVPHRILPVCFYGLIVGVLFAAPALSSDPQTMILAFRYMLYSLAALYVVVAIGEPRVLDWFCSGLIIGLLATIPIFVIQDSEYSSKLIEWGLTAPYAQDEFIGSGGEFIRYAGLSGHPNEAGHVAALSAAAAAYFAYARRKFLPAFIVSVGLLAVFYYARSRAGLFAGGTVVGLSLIVARGRVNFVRLTVMLGIVVLSVFLVLQIDFVAARFSDDVAESSNIADRLGSALAGLQVLLAHPFGLPIDVFSSEVFSLSGGLPTPHNGFIFFGGIFGLLPLLALLTVCVASLRVRDDKDVFFALFTLQITLSLFFEQLPGTCSYEFAICLLMGHTYLRTRIGRELTAKSPGRAFRRSFAPLRRGLR